MPSSRPIYLNNAGTSWPKPDEVATAHSGALEAPPGRWPELYARAQRRIARFFGVEDAPERMRLTSGCTAALGQAFTALSWREGDRVLTSGLEHHALSRWPELLSRDRGVGWGISPYSPGRPFDLEWLERELASGQVRLVAFTLASNVSGELLPARQITDLARAHGALVLVDGAQAAGIVEIDLEDLGCDLFTFAGHKGTLGPHGIGGLWVRPGTPLEPPPAACALPSPANFDEGASDETAAPLRDHLSFCDVGSVNLAGAVALAAGLEWHERQGALTGARIAPLVEELIARLSALEGVELLGASDAPRVPVLGLRCMSHSPEQLADALTARGVLAGAGHHCAPLAHRTLGLGARGSLRLSPGAFTTAAEIDHAVEALAEALSS